MYINRYIKEHVQFETLCLQQIICCLEQLSKKSGLQDSFVKKYRECQTHITAKKTTLRDPWNSANILRDPELFLRPFATPYDDSVDGTDWLVI